MVVVLVVVVVAVGGGGSGGGDNDDDDKAMSWSNTGFLRVFCYKNSYVMNRQTNGPTDGQTLL